MIEARHHWFFTPFFNGYASYMIRWNFREVIVDGEWAPAKKGTIVIGNHISWWDGFWAIYLNNRYLKKRFHAMMLEEQLSTRIFLNKIGAYSVNPGKRDIIRSLDYTRKLLRDEKNMVLFFPQGEIESMVNPVIRFEKGINRILNSDTNVQLLFYAAFVDYFSGRKPGLFFYLKELGQIPADSTGLERAYQDFYTESRNKQTNKKQ